MLRSCPDSKGPPSVALWGVKFNLQLLSRGFKLPLRSWFCSSAVLTPPTPQPRKQAPTSQDILVQNPPPSTGSLRLKLLCLGSYRFTFWQPKETTDSVILKCFKKVFQSSLKYSHLLKYFCQHDKHYPDTRLNARCTCIYRHPLPRV